MVKSIENAEKNSKALDNWVESIAELHRQKPPQTVHYSKYVRTYLHMYVCNTYLSSSLVSFVERDGHVLHAVICIDPINCFMNFSAKLKKLCILFYYLLSNRNW